MSITEPELRVPLAAEEVLLSRRERTVGRVRIETHTGQHVEQVEMHLRHDDVEIERVPIGLPVSEVPSVRQEGEVTIIPVVEEVVVVERRLMLTEEVRVRRSSRTRTHREDVVLRTQHAEIRRLPADEASAGSGPAQDSGEINDGK